MHVVLKKAVIGLVMSVVPLAWVFSAVWPLPAVVERR